MGTRGWPQQDACPGRAAALRLHRAMSFYVILLNILLINRFDWITIKWVDKLEGPTVITCAKISIDRMFFKKKKKKKKKKMQ